MKGDKKRTIGQNLDKQIEDNKPYRIEVKLIYYIEKKPESPKPVKPRK